MQYLRNILDFFFGTFIRVRNTFLGILVLIVILKIDQITSTLLSVAQKLLQAVADIITGSLPLIILILVILFLFRKAKGGGSPPPKKK
jgi:hypothetical protein